MPDPIVIAIPPHMQTRFAQMKADIQRIVDRQSEAATTLVATQIDPASVAPETGYTIALNETEIVCTPPAEAPVAS